jgi:hypothetical protein
LETVRKSNAQKFCSEKSPLELNNSFAKVLEILKRNPRGKKEKTYVYFDDAHKRGNFYSEI